MEHPDDAVPTINDVKNITCCNEKNAANELTIEDNTLSRLNLKNT